MRSNPSGGLVAPPAVPPSNPLGLPVWTSYHHSLRSPPSGSDGGPTRPCCVPDLKSFVPPFTLANRYEVAAEIGRGGFAVVFRARDRDLGLDVAIKILRTDALPHAAFERFSQEMEVTARLRHPHIVRVFDSGVIDGVPYFVMQLVLGPTLEARLAIEQALPVGDALTITRQMGEALAFAHANGVVHRDVKPANVLLAEDGARLSDFGIARVLTRADTERITSGGFTVGTTQYMSPEQLCAEPGIGARSDQYSLALVCYEMLTGVQPHVASTVDSLRALRLAGAYTAVVSHRPEHSSAPSRRGR